VKTETSKPLMRGPFLNGAGFTLYETRFGNGLLAANTACAKPRGVTQMETVDGLAFVTTKAAE